MSVRKELVKNSGKMSFFSPTKIGRPISASEMPLLSVDPQLLTWWWWWWWMWLWSLAPSVLVDVELRLSRPRSGLFKLIMRDRLLKAMFMLRSKLFELSSSCISESIWLLTSALSLSLASPMLLKSILKVRVRS